MINEKCIVLQNNLAKFFVLLLYVESENVDDEYSTKFDYTKCDKI